MNYGSEPADQVVRYSLEGAEFALLISGTAAKNFFLFAQADFHKDYTYNRQAYAAPSYCAAYMVAHRYGLDTTAFNFDRVVALYGNLGKEQQRGFLSDVNTVGGGLLRSLSRTLAVQTCELPAAEYAVAVPPAKKPSRQQERG